MKPKILVIVGPTSSGKSDLAIQIAKEFNGEIISADSRQVYKGLDIGTGKITKEEVDGVPHHLLDVANPNDVFSVSDFQKLAYEAIDEILSREKLPIIAGGTGFYIQSIVDGIVLPSVPENVELRKELSQLSLPELQQKLKELDSNRFAEIDLENTVRVIRAIEIATKIGKVPEMQKDPKYDVTQIGVQWEKEELDRRISERLLMGIDQGLIQETKNLHKNGLSWKRMEELGLEYRYVARFLQKKISKEEMIEQLTFKIIQYAKRQMTWFKRDKKIRWFKPTEKEAIFKFLRVH